MESWPLVRLDSLYDIARGGSPRPIKKFITEDPDGINWIKISDATASGKYIYETKQKIIPEGKQRSRFVNKGDFILSNSMSFGRPYIMATTGCIHDGWLVLSPKDQLIDQDFLYYILGSPFVFQQFDSLAAGSTVRNLNIDLVRGVKIPLLPIEEQKRIVAILDKVFDDIEKARATSETNLKNARELFDSYLQQVFSRQGDGWGSYKLGEICTFENGDRGKNYPNREEYVEVGVPWINTGHIEPSGYLSNSSMNYITREKFDELRSGKIQAGDLVYCLRGNTIGKTAMVYPLCEGAVASSLVIIRPSNKIRQKFLYYYLTSPVGKAQIKLYDNGAAQPNLGAKSVAKYFLYLPSPSEQELIINRVELLANQVDALVRLYQEKISRLDELKKSILQKAFSGELTKNKVEAA